LPGSNPCPVNFKLTSHHPNIISQDHNKKNNASTGLKPYILKLVVYYQARTLSYISIGIRCVVTNRLSFAFRANELKVITILLLKQSPMYNVPPTPDNHAGVGSDLAVNSNTE
jgi:hypothetical protein